MALLILLGLIYVSQEPKFKMLIDATFSEELGEQMDEKILESPGQRLEILEEPILARDVTPAEDPLAAPPIVQPKFEGLSPTDVIKAPSIGLALSGREKGMRQALHAKYGGTATTEESVKLGLEWLKRNQARDGSWSLVGPFDDGAFNENRVAATALALLAFQGAGNTHLDGEYAAEVAKGLKVLLRAQDRDGLFYQGSIEGHRLYTQAQASIALCELYGMTKDSALLEPCQRAVDYAVKSQAPEGGWRYQARLDSDTSVTGWFVMALQSALMAGLDVPSPTLDAISKFLDSVALDDGAYYKYHTSRSGFSDAMTAEGLLCRQYLGWSRNDERLGRGVELLLENPIQDEFRNVYYWYYATQVLHHMEGESWERWNRIMREAIPRQQVKSGKEMGSWPPNGDQWGNHGGRLYTTCLSVFMLEVYYRHLPIYQYRGK